MNVEQKNMGTRPCWFVGAMYDVSDQTERFLKEGIWENGYTDRYLEEVRSMRPGDRIAIKAAYVRKNDLPFDNRGHSVSVMAIKAIGTVTENPGDGRTVKVDWTQVDPPREWYFHTYRGTVWRVTPGEWTTDALIEFTFENVPQDFKEFRNRPFWAGRFGDRIDKQQQFKWTTFYEAMADKLLLYRHKRKELVEAAHEIVNRVLSSSYLIDQFADGTSGPMRDICPFTLMGTFNRGITDANRTAIAKGWAEFLEITEPIPETFEGIPILNNQRSWFFRYARDGIVDDIDVLWECFEEGVRFADAEDSEEREVFIAAYDKAAQQAGTGWALTMELYWFRPWTYPTLESQSRVYIEKKLGITIGRNGPNKRCSGDDYLAIIEDLQARFEENAFSVHSFPELSYAAWRYIDPPPPPPPPPPPDPDKSKKEGGDVKGLNPPPPPAPYSIEDILDGCFLERVQLEGILERLRTKRNIILQGPPGTGKTWLAKRLAYALMEGKDENKLRAMQFHPNLSYEDFVRGWRPDGDGRLTLVDGPFMEMVKAALEAPKVKHVMVIEEINRGNPAQIFGEILTLLEADKRTPAEALELCHRRAGDERVYVPANLYVIGTMNIADRSLALVDFALRRRFAFIDLTPVFGKAWHDWVHEKFSIPSAILLEIEKRMLLLNEEIAADTNLGRQFQIGHSFVTPPMGEVIKDARQWFRQIAATEIGPLLDEYWFDNLDKSRKAVERLLEGF